MRNAPDSRQRKNFPIHWRWRKHRPDERVDRRKDRKSSRVGIDESALLNWHGWQTVGVFRRVNNVRSEELLGCRMLQTAFGFRCPCCGRASDRVVCGAVNRLQAKCQLGTLFTRPRARVAWCSIEASTAYRILAFPSLRVQHVASRATRSPRRTRAYTRPPPPPRGKAEENRCVARGKIYRNAFRSLGRAANKRRINGE